MTSARVRLDTGLLLTYSLANLTSSISIPEIKEYVLSCVPQHLGGSYLNTCLGPV